MFTILKSDIFRIAKATLIFYSTIGLIVLGVLFGFIISDTPALDIVQNGLRFGSTFVPVFLTNVLMIAWGHEFNYRVVNNTLISGSKRWVYFVNKVLLTLLLTVLFNLIFTLSLMGTAFVLKGSFALLPIAKIFLAQLPLYFAASSLGILLFNVIKTSYVSVAVFIAIAFIGDQLISTIINTYLPKLKFINDTLFFSNIQSFTDLNVLASDLFTKGLISAVIYSVIAIGIACLSFNKREFK